MAGGGGADETKVSHERSLFAVNDQHVVPSHKAASSDRTAQVVSATVPHGMLLRRCGSVRAYDPSTRDRGYARQEQTEGARRFRDSREGVSR